MSKALMPVAGLAPLVLLAACCLHGKGPSAPREAGAALWTEVADSVVLPMPPEQRPAAYRLFSLDERQMRARMQDTATVGSVIEMPLPGGGFSRYLVMETSTLAPALLERYPNLRTYSGKGIDEPSATARFDMTSGFHGYLVTPQGSIIIDPVPAGDFNYYICYFKHDAPGTKDPFEIKADSVPHRE